MRPEAAVGGEALAARVADVRPVLGALHLALVVAQMLLQVGQLDEGPVALGKMTLVRALPCKQKHTVNTHFDLQQERCLPKDTHTNNKSPAVA
ncbi:hypothetical protein AVEN_135466-1 [Araneus ventricosus]|uniref:Uncharacterized protein n=1 Tax=Araneus ventricosus TaxID=182803 RepID=A0A4Y2BDN7_ARAVE|nr:hypothetical protein AVEN_135466-1 [Araneus ventricosus]